MRCLVLLIALVLSASSSKEELRQRIADLKIKAFEIQTQVELLEQQLKDLEQAEANQPPPASKLSAPVKVRCSGHTKDGKRCTRNAEPGSRFCWQHKARR
jgi:hypothetical protein